MWYTNFVCEKITFRREVFILDMISVLSNNNIQNVHAPLPLVAHILFCVIATALYIVQYQRKKINYYIYLLIAVDLTLMTQFFTQDYVIVAIAVAEIILLVMAFVSQWNYKKQQKMAMERKKQLAEMEKGKADGEAMTNGFKNP